MVSPPISVSVFNPMLEIEEEKRRKEEEQAERLAEMKRAELMRMEKAKDDASKLPEPGLEIEKVRSDGEINVQFSEDMVVPEDKDFDYSGVFEIVLSSSDGSNITGRYIKGTNRLRNLRVGRKGRKGSVISAG